MKMFLLCGGDTYYPQAGDCDWFGFYETYEEAKSKVIEIKTPSKFPKKTNKRFTDFVPIFVSKNFISEDNDYIYYNSIQQKLVDGDKVKEVDWYEIIDLNSRIN